MAQDIFPVRPLGKYGHTYLLDNRTHRAYRVIHFVAYVIMMVMGLIGVIGPKFYGGQLWPPEMFIFSLMAIYILWLAGTLKLVSTSRIVYGEEAKDALKRAERGSSSKSTWAKTGLILICAFTGVFSLIFLMGTVIGLLYHQPVSIEQVVTVLLGLYAFIHYFRKLIKQD